VEKERDKGRNPVLHRHYIIIILFSFPIYKKKER